MAKRKLGRSEEPVTDRKFEILLKSEPTENDIKVEMFTPCEIYGSPSNAASSDYDVLFTTTINGLKQSCPNKGSTYLPNNNQNETIHVSQCEHTGYTFSNMALSVLRGGRRGVYQIYILAQSTSHFQSRFITEERRYLEELENIANKNPHDPYRQYDFLRSGTNRRDTIEQPISTRYLGHVTGYQSIDWLITSCNQGLAFPDSFVTW
eukprot:sb/3470390/